MDDKLATFAEIGVAIAGFSGIIAALGRDPLDAWPLPRRRMMRVLLETAGLCVLFSLVPMILGELQISEHALWRSAAALFTIAHALHMARLRRGGSTPDSPTRGLRSWIAGGAGAVLAAQVVSVAVGNLALLKFVYLLALAWHVAGSALSLV